MNGPLVTVCVICFNYGRYIIESLDSIYKQTYKNIEVIIIDPQSTDPITHNLLDHMNNLYPNAKVYRIINKGLSDSRNVGMSFATGKYVSFVDADDRIAPTYIEKCVKLLENDKTLGCAYSWTKAFGDCIDTWPTKDLDINVLKNSNQAPSHTVIRKEAHDTIVKLNSVGWRIKYDGFFEDHVYWIDMVRAGWLGKCIPEPLVFHREHANNMMKDPKRAQNIKNMMIELRKDIPEIYTHKAVPVNIQLQMCKKNIAIMIPGLTCGGTERGLIEKLKAFKECGMNSVLITTRQCDHVWEDKFRSITNNIIHMPTAKANSMYFNRLTSILRKYNINILFGIHSNPFYESLSFVKNNTRNIKIVDAHHTCPGYGHTKLGVEYDKHIDNHIVITEMHRQDFINRGVNPNKIQVIYNGTDISRFNEYPLDKKHSYQPPHKLNVLFLGRLSPEKRPEQFIDIARNFRNDPSIEFILAGDGPIKDRTTNYLQNDNHGNIKIVGRINPEEALYKADVLVLTSNLEAFPYVCMESLASGCHVISTNVGEVKVSIADGEFGDIVSVDNCVNEITDRLKHININRQCLDHVREYGREFIYNNFNSRKMIAEYCDFFREI